MAENKDTKKISIIIPAYNEEDTIGRVIRIAREYHRAGEVLVVDDASTDRTRQRARLAGARVIALADNRGKAGAMHEGVRQAENEHILFLDADIKGLSAKKLDYLAAPVLHGRYDMFIAIRDRRRLWLNRILRFFPLLGGERALTKELWQKVPARYKKSFQIEIALNFYAKVNGCRMGFRLIPGLTQVIKEKKRGFFAGLWQRIKMFCDILTVSWRLYIKESLLKGKWQAIRPGIKFEFRL